MALFDESFKVGTAVAVGVGAMILLPVVAPVMATIARPLLKAGLKGGMIMFEKGREAMAEASEVLEDLMVEAKAELEAASGLSSSASTPVSEGTSGNAT